MEGAMLALLDLLLVLTLLALGWGALESRDAKRGVVLFIAFGLVLALVWARLAAPDVALAEAAIGAGLSGALLIAATRDRGANPGTAARQGTSVRVAGWVVAGLCLALAVTVGWSLIDALSATDSARLSDDVFARLAESGVTNPVTAVLLNFRAYDTLLELAVLLAALLGILALAGERASYAQAGLVLGALTRSLVPLLIIVGGYLLWVGAHAPGGAFQAGAILAGAAVLLRLSGHSRAGLPAGLALRLVSVAGIAVFVAVGLGLMLAGRPFLGYPAGWAGGLILLIETAATLAIAATLALAFIGGRPLAWDRSSAASDRGGASPSSDGTSC
jgi:multisubunit Na+/H+ antiporter MnhB subunit